MKKFVILAALVGGASFAGNATTLKTGLLVAVKKPVVNAKVVNPMRVRQLYEMVFTCEKQGWSIPVVGNTRAEMANAYMFYVTHLDC